jgi:hypothetical protein
MARKRYKPEEIVVEDRTHDGRKYRMLNVLDEFTHECLVIRVARKLKAIDVIDVLSDLFILRGVELSAPGGTARSAHNQHPPTRSQIDSRSSLSSLVFSMAMTVCPPDTVNLRRRHAAARAARLRQQIEKLDNPASETQRRKKRTPKREPPASSSVGECTS